MQTRMMAAMLRAPRRPGENGADHCRRRNQEAATACRRHGRWSAFWFRRALDWDAHLQRGHNHASWPVLLRAFHGADWLDDRRITQIAHGMRGTDTRVARGRPAMRWHDGVLYAGSLGP